MFIIIIMIFRIIIITYDTIHEHGTLQFTKHFCIYIIEVLRDSCFFAIIQLFTEGDPLGQILATAKIVFLLMRNKNGCLKKVGYLFNTLTTKPLPC